EALIAFKTQLSDPHNVLRTWNETSADPCGGCDLGSNSLSGELSPELANLTNLERLVLYNNSITGGIPEEFGTGLTSLTYLDLSRNLLNGTLQESFYNLMKLVTLNLSKNAIFDSIKDEIGNFTNLVNLDLSINAFYGEIPESLGQLSNLAILCDRRLSDNVFEGPISANFINLPKLDVLDLSENNLNGTLPEWNGKQREMTSMCGFERKPLFGRLMHKCDMR
ncbi:probable LRR receptor-like serine/threonine-protein kinase at3g47570, partial [Phtheirospermum japonicum]